MNSNQMDLDREKKQLLQIMKKYPRQPRTVWAMELGWLYSTGRPNTSKVIKLLKILETDGLIIKIGHQCLIKN